MVLDLHTHSRFSYDADQDSLESACENAIQNDLSIIGFSDHVEFFRKHKTVKIDVKAREKEIERCRQKFSDKLEILSAVEIGQPHANAKEAEEFLKLNRFDYVIGSVHAMPSDNDIYFLKFSQMDCDKFLHEYFDEMEKLVSFGKFNILAHIDYPLRVMKLPNNNPSFLNYMDRIEPIFEEIIKKGIALEINAKGLGGWQKSVGPEIFVLEKYRKLGGELLTVGSDAHSASKIGFGVVQCLEHARQAGFKAVTCFKQGDAIQYAI